MQIEDLKAQLESCHQQLYDSNKHKQELELQLRTALEREQDIRTGYISPVSYRSFVRSTRSCVALRVILPWWGNPAVNFVCIFFFFFSIQQYFLLHTVTFFACRFFFFFLTGRKPQIKLTLKQRDDYRCVCLCMSSLHEKEHWYLYYYIGFYYLISCFYVISLYSTELMLAVTLVPYWFLDQQTRDLW